MNNKILKVDYQAVLSVAKAAALDAGELIRNSRKNKDVEVTLKDRTNLVTQYDLAAEKLIIEHITKSFPDHRLLTEETNTEVADPDTYQAPLWVVDPIDGTTNFVHGHYQVSTSIGFAYQGRLRVGVVYNPFTNEMFEAIEGKGAFRNGEKISCGKTDNLSDALFVTGFPYKKEGLDVILARIKAVLTNGRELRRLGSGALDICWVADGRMDVYYESLSPWDCAGGIVIAREAGVLCGHIDELPETLNIPSDFYTEGLLFANPSLFLKAQKLLRV